MTRSKPSVAAIGSAKTVNPPDTSAVYTPARAQRGDQHARARHQPDARRSLVERRSGQPFQQRHPLRQRRGKIEFAIHRAPGDLGDMPPQADEIGEFVEHFILDDRRFEIGDEDALAPARRRLHQHVDRRAADRRAGRRLGLLCIVGGEGEIAGDARRQPIGPARHRDRHPDRFCQGRQHALRRRSRDQRHHQAHRRLYRHYPFFEIASLLRSSQ